ncbi:MAG: HpcH/HpaI aldolase family protein [Thermomicrobiales bacterium]
MRENHVKRALREGRPSVGTWLSYGAPLAVEAMTTVGFDWLTIDWEHNAIDIETVALMMAAMRGTACAPMVRLPQGHHENIKRVLDAGAWGIVAPMVNTVEEAQIIARAAKHPPVGNRSFGGGRYNASFDAQPGEYNKRANDEICVILMIESPEGINNLDAMLEAGGIDGIFVGPNDMLGNMGEAPAMWSEAKVFQEGMRHILQTCKKHKVAAGIHCADHKAVSDRIAEGYQFLALASEARFMLHEGTIEAQSVKGWSPRTQSEVIKY